MFMSGYLPFQGQGQEEVFQRIRDAGYHFEHEEFQQVSEEAKDLISRLLVTNPLDRLTASEALQHPWFEKIRQQIDEA